VVLLILGKASDAPQRAPAAGRSKLSPRESGGALRPLAWPYLAMGKADDAGPASWPKAAELDIRGGAPRQTNLGTAPAS